MMMMMMKMKMKMKMKNVLAIERINFDDDASVDSKDSCWFRGGTAVFSVVRVVGMMLFFLDTREFVGITIVTVFDLLDHTFTRLVVTDVSTAGVGAVWTPGIMTMHVIQKESHLIDNVVIEISNTWHLMYIFLNKFH